MLMVFVLTLMDHSTAHVIRDSEETELHAKTVRKTLSRIELFFLFFSSKGLCHFTVFVVASFILLAQFLPFSKHKFSLGKTFRISEHFPVNKKNYTNVNNIIPMLFSYIDLLTYNLRIQHR